MFIIEYISTPKASGEPALFEELALGSTPEEAKDQADMRLPSMMEKYGALGYRIIDKEKRCVGIGPVGFLDAS
jgi:hypothetical protein